MLAFALKRILWTIPVLFVCATLLFGVMRAMNSSPLRHGPLLGLSNTRWVKYGDYQPQGIERNQKRIFHLNSPWYEQYYRYLKMLAKFDFGPTFTFRYRTVNSILRGIPLGIVAALWSGTLVDRVVTSLLAVTMGLPNFFIAALLGWLFAVRAGVVPVFGWDEWRAKILPSFILSLVPMALIARVLRAQMIEALGSEHVRAARGRGLRRGRIIRAHVLPGALIPVLSMTGPLIGHLVTGLFVVEWAFSIPGIGRYFIAAAGAGDYPLTLGLTAVLTLSIVIANLLSDIALAAIDPRVREA
jgi:ABC-type dipeptide/oligopeptide/nickel transport system permease component